jgi:hypothetical protein
MRLEPIPAGYDRAARQAHELDSYLQRKLAGRMRGGFPTRCSSQRYALSVARQALQKFGMSSWRVTEPYGDKGQCFGGQIDSQQHTVQVMNLEPNPAAVAADNIIDAVMTRPNSVCTAGSAPENTAKIVAELRTALRGGGLGTWTIVVGHQVSSSEPCYPSGYRGRKGTAGLYHWLEIEPGSW